MAIAVTFIINNQKVSAQNWLLGGNTTTQDTALGTKNLHSVKIISNNVERIHVDKGGNIGIGNSLPAYPLSFANSLGDKISLYGNSGVHFGFGIQNALLQIYTDNSPADIAFGYGSSAAFTENMRIKGNGNVGIGNNNPTYKLDVNSGASQLALRINGTNPSITINSTSIANSGNDLYIAAVTGSKGYPSGNLILQNGGFNGMVGIGTTNPLQKLHVFGASILANNTTINPSTTANSVIAGAIHDGSGWNVTSGIGGKASGKGQEWGIGAINNSLYFGIGDGSRDSTMQTGIQIVGNTNGSRNVLLIPSGSGNVGIGTTNPQYKLSVNGTIQAKELIVETGWSDYVFDKNYKLLTLNEVQNYINTNKHLPDVPSATEVENNGVKVAQMDSILIKKVEELTLYVIDQNKQIQQLRQNVKQLEHNDVDKKN